MSQPRRIRPGVTWFVTRRTTRRYMLLRPDPDGMAQRIYWYVTAVLAAKFGIELHAVQVLSTHLHEVLTDVRGLLPDFLRERNRILANVLKRHRDWREEVFQRAPASCVELYGANAVLKEIGYTLANCVEAGLVHDPRDWPGVTVRIDDIGQRVVDVERPSMYFAAKNRRWPERTTLAITMPQILTKVYGTRASDVLRAAVDDAVERARKLAQRARYVVKAIATLYNVRVTRRAQSREPTGKRNPTFATGGNPELTKQAAEEVRTFRTLYRQARDALKRGLATVSFPEGTWRWCRELLPSSSFGVAQDSMQRGRLGPPAELLSMSVRPQGALPSTADPVAPQSA
jgi:putative transposase